MINLLSSPLLHRLKESVDFQRIDLSDDPYGEAFTTVASDQEIAIIPNTTQNEVRSTGQVFVKGEYNGIMLTANTALMEGDIVIRGTGKRPDRLYIIDIAEVENIQLLGLTQTKQ